LYREYMLTIEILMQAVEVSGPVLQQEWRGPRLTGIVTALDELGVLLRIVNLDPHAFVPMIRNRDEFTI